MRICEVIALTVGSCVQTPEYIAAYRPSEELGGTDEVTAGVWDVPQPVGDAEDENATSSRHPATHQASLGSQYAERLDGQQHLPSYQDETYDNDTYDETYDSSDDDGAEDRKAEASKKADTRTEAAAPKTTLQWLYQLAGGGAELQKEQKEPQPSNSAGFQPRRPRPPPKKKQVSITQAMLFHNAST